MKNIPDVKLGLIAVSRDCFPIALSEKRRAAIAAAYPGELYECPVTVENELDMLKAVADVKEKDCNALVVFLGNFGPETPETLIAKNFDGPCMFVAAAEGDGPAQFGGFTGMNAGTGFPSSSTLAQSWNSAMAQEEGRTIGAQGAQRGYSGWYAPAMNMHRSPFNGRNYEYYSEDALLSGVMCGNTVKGAKESGIYCYIKHFICNDGESYIYRDSVYTWMSEQALREVYLEPFRIVIENYGATGLMSSYNRIGAVWAGGSTALLTGILRDEWGFQGAVITDYSDHHEYMNGDQMLRAGGDLWMDGFGGSLKYETQSNSYQQALRRASKHIIYMYLNARAENKDYAAASGNASAERPLVTTGTPLWKTLVMGVNIVVGVLFALAL